MFRLSELSERAERADGVTLPPGRTPQAVPSSLVCGSSPTGAPFSLPLPLPGSSFVLPAWPTALRCPAPHAWVQLASVHIAWLGAGRALAGFRPALRHVAFPVLSLSREAAGHVYDLCVPHAAQIPAVRSRLVLAHLLPSA